MTIEQNWWPWKPSLFSQYRARIANELRVAQNHERLNEVHREISSIEKDLSQIVNRMSTNDFIQIEKEINAYVALCEAEQNRTIKEYHRVKKQLNNLVPKLLIGSAYLSARHDPVPIETQLVNNKKRRKRLKLSIEQQWRRGIGDAYRRLQSQRDRNDTPKPNQSVNISIFIEPLPILYERSCDEPPIIPDPIVPDIHEHEFIAPLPPPLADEIIIPFQTPPTIPCPFLPSDQLHLTVDDTIVKPHRLNNKTLGNITRLSFNIDPDQCSSPKPEDKKKKTKLKKLMLPPAPPPPPLFSSTAIFDAQAFFTQNNAKTKKQKKKIDISRQPVVMKVNDPTKKKSRTKKSSPYDFQDDECSTLPQSKGARLLTDDIITARFAKNSHFQSHQSSMASVKSSKCQRKPGEREHKKKKRNILGIGTSSPSGSSANLTLSPGRLSTDDKDDDYEIKSSLSRRHNRTKTTNKSRRTRVK